MEDPIGPGAIISRYRIVKQLGAGGMGEVYLAHDDTLGRMVALKILHADVASDEQRMRRFTQEAKTTSALNHPNILTVHEIGQAGSTQFIATEFVEGVTLRERMRQSRMNIDQVLDVAIQVARGIEKAHEAGVIHRDIKPENIMLRPDGYVKVLDFGIAKLADRIDSALMGVFAVEPDRARTAINADIAGDPPPSISQSAGFDSPAPDAPTVFRGNTGTNELVGTIEYVSPEQARGLTVDSRTDIFSFGVVLYEMIAGRMPFTGKTGSEILTAILRSGPTPLSHLSPATPSELERIVERALRKERYDRYQTIRELARDLKHLRQELEFRAKLADSDPENRAAYKVSDRQGAFSPTDSTDSERTASATSERRHNLPAPLTTLIGRQAEIDRTVNLLRTDTVRLLTLTGPGGTGKTRLALETASELLSDFADGVFFVALASVTASDLVAMAIARTLEVQEEAGTSLIESLKNQLSDKSILLVLDNFEQVIRASPLVAELLSASSRLKILVTTRSVLRLRGEQEFPVPPLTVPSLDLASSTEVLAQYSAVALFVERALSARPDFALTYENARAIAEICLRLDGLPLAIELAAARVKLLSPQAMLPHMEQRLKLLTGGAADLPARQQTMRSTIGWSYDLLDQSEREVFARLSVFVNGCSLEAIDAICDVSSFAEVDLFDTLGSLVDKSLLQQRELRNGEPRFAMLGTINEYAGEKLVAAGELEVIRRRHAEFFMKLAEKAEPELTTATQVAWYDRLEREHDNLRAALRWSKGSGEIEIALRIAGALWRFWEVRGHQSEGRGWFEQLLSESKLAAPAIRAKALSRAGALERDQGAYARGFALLAEALRLYQELGDRWGTAATLNGIGYAVHERGDFAGAVRYYEESLALFRELGDKRASAYLLNNLGNVAKEQADYPRASLIHEEALALFRELGDKRALSASLNNVGEIAQHQGDLDRAAALHRESLALKREVGDTRGIAISLDNLGDVARYRGEYANAASLYHESLTLHRATGDKRSIAHCLEALAEAACANGEAARAAKLFGAAEALRETIGAPLPVVDLADYNRNVAAARAALGEDNFITLRAEGRTLPLDQAIAHALEASE